MRKKILLTKYVQNPDYDSAIRRDGLKRLDQLAELQPYDGTLKVRDAKDVVGVIADAGPIQDRFYENASDLRIISRWGVGYDNLNVELATKFGIMITIAPEHMESVAEYTIALWMATLKRVDTLNRLAHTGDSSFVITYEAKGSTLGLYGFGRIGQAVAVRAKPLLGDDGKLLVYDVRPDIKQLADRFDAVCIDNPLTLFRDSDVVSLHVSGNETIVGDEQLRVMKPHASLINPSRGGLVDDEAIHRAVREDRVWSYVVDDPTDGPRKIHRNQPRIVCTNHNAGLTVQSAMRLDGRTIGQVHDALQGREPPHLLNPEVLDHPRVKAFLKD